MKVSIRNAKVHIFCRFEKKKLLYQKKFVSLHSISRREIWLESYIREYSSVGLEHLPYKQRVIGSNPITPTKRTARTILLFFFYIKWANENKIATTYNKNGKTELCINSPK